MRFLAWSFLILLLLTCGLWASTRYRAVRIQRSGATRRLAVMAMPGAVEFDQLKPPMNPPGFEVTLEPNDTLHLSFAAMTPQLDNSIPGVQIVHLTSNSLPVYLTVVMVRWWWLVVPLVLLTALAWILHGSRRSHRARGFTIEAQSAASADASR